MEYTYIQHRHLCFCNVFHACVAEFTCEPLQHCFGKNIVKSSVRTSLQTALVHNIEDSMK